MLKGHSDHAFTEEGIPFFIILKLTSVYEICSKATDHFRASKFGAKLHCH
jgi:hypothetical protein